MDQQTFLPRLNADLSALLISAARTDGTSPETVLRDALERKLARRARKRAALRRNRIAAAFPDLVG